MGNYSRSRTARKEIEDPPTLHDARHTFTSYMIDAGCDAKALSVVMGHASVSITFDTYGHLMPGGE
jgi:integrase